MSDLVCHPQIQEGELLTVGHRFFVGCQGDFTDLKTDQVRLNAPPKDQYKIVLLDSKLENKNFLKLEVTSYVTGDHALTGLILADGQLALPMSPLAFRVQSILQAEDKGQPFGPMGPLQTGIPVFYKITGLAALSLILILAVIWALLKVRRRRLMKSLESFEDGQKPIAQFFKTTRLLMRTSPVFIKEEATTDAAREVIESIGKAFEIFLIRQCRVPAHVWSPRKVKKFLQKEQWSEADDVARLLSELKKARSPSMQAKMTAEDAQLIVNQCRRLVDALAVKGGR